MSILEAIIFTLTETGLIALLAIAVITGELIYFTLRGRSSPKWRGFIPNALSGLTMLIALYVALTDLPKVLIVLALSLGFVAHIADMFARLKTSAKE